MVEGREGMQRELSLKLSASLSCYHEEINFPCLLIHISYHVSFENLVVHRGISRTRTRANDARNYAQQGCAIQFNGIIFKSPKKILDGLWKSFNFSSPPLFPNYVDFASDATATQYVLELFLKVGMDGATGWPNAWAICWAQQFCNMFHSSSDSSSPRWRQTEQ